MPDQTQSSQDSAFNLAELGDAPQIDLHGLSQTEALFRVKDFLRDHAKMGTPAIRILHGKGTDALQTMLRRQLPKLPQVEVFRPSSMPSDIGAVMIVILKQN